MPQLMPLLWIMSFFIFFYFIVINSIIYGQILLFKGYTSDMMKNSNFKWLW